MQRVLAQAKNGDELFWEEKFHAPNGKPQACTQGALLFFLLSLGEWGWGGEGFSFSFSPRSQWVPIICPLSSQWVPNLFPNMFFHSTSLLSHVLWQMLSSFHLSSWAKVGEFCTLNQNHIFWGSYHSFFFNF